LASGVGVSPGSLHFTDVDMRAWWFPIDVAAGVAFQSSSVELLGDLGPEASVLSISADNLDRAEHNVRVDLGARASVGARFWLSEKIAVLVATHAAVFPHPYRLVIDGEGDVGSTPAFWWGAMIGFVRRVD
jgi:hypothetical protein